MKNFKKGIMLLFVWAIVNHAQSLPSKGLCAHRGASSTHPENTKAAIIEAVNLGVQMIEFDVRKTKDNKLVVMHNKSVDKTTNGKGNIEDLTLDEISKLDAGSWKDIKFAGEKVPLLEEVLDNIPDTIWMNIHIKEDVETAKAVAEMLNGRNQINNALLAVENDAVSIIKRINNEIKICCMERGNSTGDYLKNAEKVNADFIQLTDRELPVLKQIIPILKKNNIKINFYYADSVDKLKLLVDAGIDFVLTNNVSELIASKKK